MSQTDATQAPAAEAGLDAGTYEVLSARLADQATELADRAEALNAQRLEVFGGTELSLLGTERIRTDNNCVPRDIVQVDGNMLFGYNVHIGLKPTTAVADVFSVYRFDRNGEKFSFTETGGDLLSSEGFGRDFAELYRYYRDARLLQLRRLEGRLLAVFQVGERTGDIKVLRWRTGPNGEVSYLDNQGDRDHVFPEQHDFEWIAATRDDHVNGRNPHVSVLDEVFVECVGGDLTIKIENNTDTGEGVYAEPVVDPNQNLADASIAYARIGPLILLRILPYNEADHRYLVFNTRTKTVVRLDAIGQACRTLPEDQGIIFPDGYYLSTGVYKTFDHETAGLEFEREIRSPNGEDVAYVFHSREDGRTLLLPYNVIRESIANPIVCHGFSLFDDGTMVAFRASSDEPTRVHPMQVWQTPFVSDTFAAAQPVGTGPLERLGNAELVRGVSEALSVARMVAEMAPGTEVFEALIAACTRVLDGYHWLGEAELGGLAEPLESVRATATQVLDEYATVSELTAQAGEAVATAERELTTLVRRSRGESPKAADAWVALLAELRRAQGHLITLRDLRYVDTERLDALDATVGEELTSAARRAVAFFQREDAFAAYSAEIERLTAAAEAVDTVANAAPLTAELTDRTADLENLTQVVSDLDIADAVVRTSILERIAEVLAAVNRARATLAARRRELLAGEGRAEFAAEFALFTQAVTAGLAAADTPSGCDDQLGRLMLQLENLETRFGEFDDFLTELGDKRTEVYEAFSSRKQTLLDDRARRAERLGASAERILGNVTRRVAGLESLDEINTYFATDPMLSKLRDIVAQLRDLDETVRAEELDGRIKAARQEAGRALRDRQDLFDGDSVKLGQHRLPVNSQPLDLTLVPDGDGLAFSLTGTDFRQPVTDPDFAVTKPFWGQSLVSETPAVYRAEHLASSIMDSYDGDRLREAALSETDLLRLVRQEAESRYDEGYERGVHDQDTTEILRALLRLESAAGLLRFPPDVRAAAGLYWAFGPDKADRELRATRAASLARARAAFTATGTADGRRDATGFGPAEAVGQWCDETAAAIAEFLTDAGLPTTVDLALTAAYLFEELARADTGFVAGAAARNLVAGFRSGLGREALSSYEADLAALEDDLAARHQVVTAWLSGYAAGREDFDGYDLPEAVAIELCGSRLPRRDSGAELSASVSGLLGTHPRIEGRTLTFRLDELLARTAAFRRDQVPGFRDYQRRRAALVEAERDRLRIEEYRPKVMSAFVRNKLLDDVYLPLIGANLAKQLGAAGDGKRTDQSGMLLLISPPGYGKTTLMEYVASRLGMVFVKVNGPALGHDVTSIDPDEAPNATARAEVAKISFALETGNNAMLYLDDIQHTNPELLQKFISMCDAQRRMEGVWNGRTRTYDLRGKRFAVVMAGNPYTESGQRFKVPDMLANRADVWNLGDVLSGREEAFALSYLENSLTSNPVLAPLANRERTDVELLARIARGDSTADTSALSHPYSATELERILSVLGKLVRVQQVVMTCNRTYIDSAAQADASRTEPPFGLQGSYRNMNKLAERIAPVMNDEELEAVIDDHYLGEAQTLTSGAEANLLKLAQLRDRMSAEQAQRWDEVTAGFRRRLALGGDEQDPATRAVGALGLLSQQLGAIETAIGRAAAVSLGTVTGRAKVAPPTTASPSGSATDRIGET